MMENHTSEKDISKIKFFLFLDNNAHTLKNELLTKNCYFKWRLGYLRPLFPCSFQMLVT